MMMKRSVVLLVSSLVLTAVTGGLSGQVTKLTDPDVFPASVINLRFTEGLTGTPATSLYRVFGVRFLSDGGGLPQIRHFVISPSVPPIGVQVLRHATPEESAGNGALLILFDFPVRRVGMNLSNGDAGSMATLQAFTPGCEPLGGVTQEGLTDIPGVFLGVETTNPAGISTLRLAYEGDDPEEQIQDLRFEPLTPQSFQVYLAQVASGSAGNLRIETVVQVQNLLGGSQTTRIDFFDDNGDPIQVTIDGELVTSLEFTLTSRASRIFHVGDEGSLQSGYARVESDQPVLAQAIYRVFREGELAGEAGIDSASARYSQALTFELTSDLELGLAIVNPGAATAHIGVAVINQDVTDFVQANVDLEPGQHRAFFISELVESLDQERFPGGVVRITSTQPVAVTGLRTRAGVPSASLATGSTEP